MISRLTPLVSQSRAHDLRAEAERERRARALHDEQRTLVRASLILMPERPHAARRRWA